MKHYKTAKAILAHSLEDIQSGLWCKSQLAEYGTCRWEDGFEERIVEDSSFPELRDAVSADLHRKPMGCALGLVSMYGGHGDEIDVQVNGCRLISFVPFYPTFGEPNPGVVAAVKALFDALPKSSREEAAEDGDGLDVWENWVYSHNDSSWCTQGRAAAWFRKALALA